MSKQESQSELPTKLTGHMRFQLVPIWFKQKEFEGTFEEFVIQVCKAKGIDYVPPKPREERK